MVTLSAKPLCVDCSRPSILRPLLLPQSIQAKYGRLPMLISRVARHWKTILEVLVWKPAIWSDIGLRWIGTTRSIPVRKMDIFEWHDAFLSTGVVFANEQCFGLMLDFGHLVSPILPNVETMPTVLSNRKRMRSAPLAGYGLEFPGRLQLLSFTTFLENRFARLNLGRYGCDTRLRGHHQCFFDTV